MSKSILIVDDTQTVRSAIRIILQQEGYQVREAENGEEGLEQIHASPPDLVLLDLMMPGMSGIELCRKLKGNTATSDLKVIMITTRSEGAEVKEAFEAGCSGYLLKPIDRHELTQKIERVFKLSEARSTLRKLISPSNPERQPAHIPRRNGLPKREDRKA